ncbi:NAD(+)--dinitrogen-reductase ADP-D-ribosyltransferase [Dechloromonas sp. HYN0024]|uniref:NAD(+)--dinitrogen-reductase ADP-D-ribosyltransferase n=1 Tax=Dechloromonas sp. HYN0024 TaxID=2231055 RepID=UPI000E442765|nr:NAD(+)--dinitrogen-reductase ADP-D-ribosyltransferase [Dechloromonas sp. HYN0024]AXS79732.1 NAD(+)--dinitrogen-reductase ADP-D-ribosyltransferase [Dechloromonas sp. HYN0024]
MKPENEPASVGVYASDNSPTLCRGDDNVRGHHGLPDGATHKATLPRDARLPINRCNLPAVVLGGLTYQHYPSPLLIDGVAELHADLFRRLAAARPEARGEVFRDYLTVHFRLERPEEIGLSGEPGSHKKSRAKANYIRMVRGWSFDSDSREGAVLKGWVESRFGLMPRYHGQPLRDPAGDGYRRYQEMRSHGLYGTNALEAQFDLLYTFCQFELAERHPGARHVTLYRGVNRLADHEVLKKGEGGQHVVLLNNLNSFTCSRERACEFGDYILAVDIPLTKIFFHCGLLPGVLQGEDEFLVIGGVVEVTLSTM